MRSKKILSAVATLALLATWVMPAAALSTVTNSVNQDTTGFIINGGFQEAELEDNAFQNATGSIGMNNAAGSLNQQANQLYINQTATELTLAGVNTQSQFDSTVDLEPSNGNFYSSGNNEATYEDNVFQNAHGNIGANNAGGNLNQQQNTATILSSCNNQCGNGPELTGGDIPQISLDQTTGNLSIDGSSGPSGGPTTGSDGNNLATYDDHAFAGASGNIGTNNAAGNMNQQGNQLVLITNGEMENLQVSLSQDNTDTFSTFSAVANDTNNIANFDGSAFSTASGNIGVNNAAGDMNQQANQAVLNVPASPAPTATEPPEGNDPIAPTTLMLNQTSTGQITNAGNQEAEFEGNSFQTVTGNVGVNNAAGTLNQQQNQLYLDTHAEEIALTIANSQSQDGVSVAPDANGQNLSAGNNEATLEDNAFQNASGNIGMNNAAGNANQQQNGAAIFSNTCVNSCGGATELENGAQGATISISQESGALVNGQGNSYVGVADNISEPANGANNAIFEDNAFQAASGNVGANNASGNMNQQGNELVLMTNGELEGVTLSVDQTSAGNSVNHDTGNIANFDGHAFANASGNVGVNNAAGDLNQQSNVAVMNVASKTPTTPKVGEGVDGFEPVTNSFSQTLFATTVLDAGNQEGEFEGNAFSNATGNIGVNNAGGTQNQQGNALYIDQLTEKATLSVSNAQALVGVFMDSGDANGNNEATLEDNVFSNASGNIGVNNAGGNANQQQNSATILSNVCGDPACGKSLNVNGGDALSDDSVSIDQVAFINFYDGSGGPTTGESEGNNQATLENNAFQNAKGNIGVNNAAGNMNQQSNQMVLITNATLSSLSAHIGQATFIVGVTNDTGNIANFQGNAFQNASGNVSANNAAGDLNQQANQTIINTKP